MLTTALQFAPRARSLNPHHVSSVRALGAAGVHHRQQTRGCRWGPWANYLDDEFRREVRRRQRILKHKHPDQTNRRASWDRHPLAEDARRTLKRMINSCWHTNDARPGGRSGDEAEPVKKPTPENYGGARPGQNIEDVERGAMDHLIFGQDGQHDPSASAGPAWRTRRKRRLREASYGVQEHYKPVEQGDYVIDPITNRKIAKQPASSHTEDGGNIPIKTFKDYRSRFGPVGFGPDNPLDPFGVPRSVEHLRKYNNVDIDSNSEGLDASAGASHRLDPVLQSDNQASAVTDVPGKDKWETVLQEAARYTLLDPHQDKPTLNAGDDAAKLREGMDYQDMHQHEPAEELAQSDNLHRHKTAVDDSHDQFDDLKPPHEDLHDIANEPWLAEELSKRIEKVSEPSDIDQHRPSMGEDAAVSKDVETVHNDLDQSQAVRQNEPDGKPMGFAEECGKLEDFVKYKSFTERLKPEDLVGTTAENPREPSDCSRNQGAGIEKSWDHSEPDGRPAQSAEELRKKYRDMNEHEGAVHHNEPDGQPAAQTDKPQDLLEQLDAHKDYDSPVQLRTKELDSADEPAQELPQKLKPVEQGEGMHSNYHETMLDSLMDRHGRLSDAMDREASLAVKSWRAKIQHPDIPRRKMTGNYVRDFPEEFEKSWTEILSSLPAESTETHSNEFQSQSERMDGGSEGAFSGSAPSKIQPALDRQLGQKPVMNDADPRSGKPQDLETSPAAECSRHTQPPQVEQNEISTSTDKTSKEVPEETSSSAVEEPIKPSQEASYRRTDGATLYKILAYDPVMQKVDMAETTSFVPDFSSALSPADALLRLSHPTKFFPHFEGLETEGFEIVSGSGDVLIFRKVRPSSTKKAEERPAETKAGTASATAEAEYQPASTTPINPIDMTGRPKLVSPASANFASPTGYVTYENLPENEASNLPPPPPPRVKYNIDLRRLEPVYSGPKETRKQQPKRGLVKRLLVGGFWVAGISYGLGVVSEYFTTGGMDGMGPTGF